MDKYMEYFFTNKDHYQEWSYSNFKEHLSKDAKIPYKESTLKICYVKCLDMILNDIKTPKAMKDHVKRLKKQLNFSNNSEGNSFVNYNYGTASYFQGVNNVNQAESSSSQQELQQQKPQQQQTNDDDNEEKEESNKRKVANIETDDEDTELQKDDSFGSGDYTPKRKRRISFNNNNGDFDDALNENIPDEEKWTIGEWNITDYLLFEYRQKSLYNNINKKNQEQSPARLLSLGHIFYFPLANDDSCVKYLPSYMIDIIYAHVSPTITAAMPSDVVVVLNEAEEALSTKNERKILLTMGKMMVKAAESGNDLFMKSVNVIVDLSKQLLRQQNKSPKYFGEDTFIHKLVAPFIDNIFYGPHLGFKWANARLATCISSSSQPQSQSSPSLSKRLLPDFTLFCDIFNFRYDLLVIEVKPPGNSNAYDDFFKVVTEMHYMLDKLVGIGAESPKVCGIWINGMEVHTYSLSIDYNGIYALVELDEFSLPSTIDQLYNIKKCLKSFFRLKEIITITNNNIVSLIKSKNSSHTNIDRQKVPKKSWRRKEMSQYTIKLSKTD
ncbi:unnamed protein product [Cunninghamella blakesleeana]